MPDWNFSITLAELFRGKVYGALLAVMTCHLPNVLRGIARSLRGARDLLKLPVTTDGQP